MTNASSPLRYPGGKASLLPLVSSVLKINNMTRRQYAEPFAGGGGLALTLLYEGYVSDVHLNDVDPSIWAFWSSILRKTDDFIKLVESTPVTVREWRRQRKIYLEQDKSNPLALGFSTFFLNRTNRSGVIKSAGVIGGLDQSGNYKIDCRFNRSGLIQRIERIAKYKSRIHVHKKDAVRFLDYADANLGNDTFFFIDPPYYKKGSRLYKNFYRHDDHAVLASRVLRSNSPWLVTYDNNDEIRGLYGARRQFEFNINYSVETKRQGTELLLVSKGLRMPSEVRNRQIGCPKKRAA